MSHPFGARFPGTCGCCLERFPVGALLRYDAAGNVVHHECPAPALTDLDIRPGETACPNCHLIHRGECY